MHGENREADPFRGSDHVADVDDDKIDDCVLALLYLTLHDGARAWKGFDFEVMDRLFQKTKLTSPLRLFLAKGFK